MFTINQKRIDGMGFNYFAKAVAGSQPTANVYPFFPLSEHGFICNLPSSGGPNEHSLCPETYYEMQISLELLRTRNGKV